MKLDRLRKGNMDDGAFLFRRVLKNKHDDLLELLPEMGIYWYKHHGQLPDDVWIGSTKSESLSPIGMAGLTNGQGLLRKGFNKQLQQRLKDAEILDIIKYGTSRISGLAIKDLSNNKLKSQMTIDFIYNIFGNPQTTCLVDTTVHAISDNPAKQVRRTLKLNFSNPDIFYRDRIIGPILLPAGQVLSIPSRVRIYNASHDKDGRVIETFNIKKLPKIQALGAITVAFFNREALGERKAQIFEAAAAYSAMAANSINTKIDPTDHEAILHEYKKLRRFSYLAWGMLDLQRYS